MSVKRYVDEKKRGELRDQAITTQIQRTILASRKHHLQNTLPPRTHPNLITPKSIDGKVL